MVVAAAVVVRVSVCVSVPTSYSTYDTHTTRHHTSHTPVSRSTVSSFGHASSDKHNENARCSKMRGVDGSNKIVGSCQHPRGVSELLIVASTGHIVAW